jgi:hypothetical protein
LVNSVPTSKPVAKTTQSSSYSCPSTTTPLDPAAVGVDQRHVGTVERRQVLVAEARTLAHHLVVGLEGLGGRRILHDGVHPTSNLLHLCEVGDLGLLNEFLFAEPFACHAGEEARDLAKDVSPAVPDEVDVLLPAGHQHVEVGHPLVMPSGLELIDPLRIGRDVPAHTDRRRGALEHVEMSGALGEVRDALHPCGSRADDPDALVGKPRQVTPRIRVVPTTGVECVTFVGVDAGDSGQLRAAKWAARRDDEARAHLVVPV